MRNLKIRPVLFACITLIAFTSPALARDKFLDIEEVKTESGLSAWLVEDHSVPVIAIEFSFKDAGSVRDPADKQGLARLLSNTMDEGAGQIKSEEFQKELRDLSISLSFSNGRDSFGGSLKTLAANKERAFTLLQLALNEPRFDEEPVARMRAANQSRIRSSIADPEWIAARILNDVAYKGHPYALNSGGTLSSLDAITPDDLRAFSKQYLTRDRLFIAISGAITADEAKAFMDQVFLPLPATSEIPVIPAIALQNKGQSFLYDMDIPQTIIQIMQPGIAKTDPGYHNAQIMNFILGSSGFGSRLTEEIREKRGLTYGIYSYFNNMDHFNGLGISTSTANKNADEMLKILKEEWQKMRSYPVTQEELDNAKSYLIGSMPLSLTSTDRIAALLLSIQLDNLGIDYLDKRQDALQKATLDDIFKISQSLLAPENFVTVLVGKPQSGEGIDGATVVKNLPNVE